jgi:phosphohistidine phosphatase
MRVVLVRHAHAVEAPYEDALRWLSAKGRQAARRLGERLRADEISFTILVTSPLVRAVQTAEVMAAAMGWRGEIESLPLLAPGGSVRAAAGELRRRGEPVCAVGHEPGISALAAQLVGKAFPAFKKGQASIFDDDRLVATVDPDSLPGD